jgi:hypothetical protein
MPDPVSGGAALLKLAYDELDLTNGRLIDVHDDPVCGTVADWTTLAARVGAERVFFVEDDPVLVFSVLQGDVDESEVLELYRRTWCLARPRCLFLAIGNELRVYSLSQPPTRAGTNHLNALQVVERAGEVGDVLDAYRRERIESGAAFEAGAFGNPKGRADRRLLQDVRLGEQALMSAGLTRRGAHALIERAILVRYLEDRKVLTPTYFEAVAADRPEWRAVLQSFEQPVAGASSVFVSCLADRELTDAVFARLAKDFNGDLFVDRTGDLAELTDDQLGVLADLLRGASSVVDEPLFFWAYDFSVVPTSLISSMYELFYRRESERKTSTYYTPRSLVEFVVSSVMTHEVLASEPTVCDPACGSGVFLVEAFRRIVRFETERRGDALTAGELKELLLRRVRGVDIDEAAVRLAAFSLYLAYLDMQSPPDILEAGPLPPLIAEHGVDCEGPLTIGDAFGDDVLSDGRFDIVVTNPPWTEPRRSSPMEGARRWADGLDLRYGDNNPSQLFIWRALQLLRPQGQAALLIAAGALLNARSTSQAFRKQWLERATVQHVTALWPVRGDFFAGARAPFGLVRFQLRTEDDRDPVVVFDTARRGGPRDGSLTFLPMKRRRIRQDVLSEHDFLWKTMTQGGRRDVDLVLRLAGEERPSGEERLSGAGQLADLVSAERPPRFGWQRPHGREKGKEPSAELRQMVSLKKLESWGPIQEGWTVDLPERITRPPHDAVFNGRRLLVDMGVTADERLGARLETGPLAFDHNIWGLPLQHRAVWEAEVALGILLSSTGRYFLSMTSGIWGVAHDQIRKEQLLRLPIRTPSPTDPAVVRICKAVKQLPAARQEQSLLDQSSIDPADLIAEIDRAVFELFDLADFERDLIRDHWRERTAQREPGSGISTLPPAKLGQELKRYTTTFIHDWRPLLGGQLDLSWKAYSDPSTASLAVVFALEEGTSKGGKAIDDVSWGDALNRLAGGASAAARGLRAFDMVRAVTNDEIIIVKRDRAELWTATAAREDAEATTVQATLAQRA